LHKVFRTKPFVVAVFSAPVSSLYVNLQLLIRRIIHKQTHQVAVAGLSYVPHRVVESPAGGELHIRLRLGGLDYAYLMLNE
jgi:hypothetical protein